MPRGRYEVTAKVDFVKTTNKEDSPSFFHKTVKCSAVFFFTPSGVAVMEARQDAEAVYHDPLYLLTTEPEKLPQRTARNLALRALKKRHGSLAHRIDDEVAIDYLGDGRGYAAGTATSREKGRPDITWRWRVPISYKRESVVGGKVQLSKE